MVNGWWFLAGLSSGERYRARDMARRWDVAEKTAKMDIADLKSKGVIAFSGSPRKGFYHLVQGARKNDE